METSHESNGLKPDPVPGYDVRLDGDEGKVKYFDGKASVSVGTTWFEANLYVSIPQGWSSIWRAAFQAAAAILWHDTGSVLIVKHLAVPFMVERLTRNGSHVFVKRDSLEAWLARKAAAVQLQNELRLPVPPCHPGGPPVA